METQLKLPSFFQQLVTAALRQPTSPTEMATHDLASANRFLVGIDVQYVTRHLIFAFSLACSIEKHKICDKMRPIVICNEVP